VSKHFTQLDVSCNDDMIHAQNIDEYLTFDYRKNNMHRETHIIQQRQPPIPIQ
jgi:hypothetical protein